MKLDDPCFRSCFRFAFLRPRLVTVLTLIETVAWSGTCAGKGEWLALIGRRNCCEDRSGGHNWYLQRFLYWHWDGDAFSKSKLDWKGWICWSQGGSGAWTADVRQAWTRLFSKWWWWAFTARTLIIQSKRARVVRVHAITCWHKLKSAIWWRNSIK